jgi:mannosyltransferase OCH1-like enzyme
MRPRIAIFLIFVLLILGFLATRLVAFIQLFFEHSGIAITQDEIAAAHHATTPDPRPQLIPKILHQVFHDWRNESMPPDWNDVRHTCIDLNKDWEYKVRGLV